MRLRNYCEELIKTLKNSPICPFCNNIPHKQDCPLGKLITEYKDV